MRILSFLILLILISSSSKSQRLYTGQKGISLAVGFVDRLQIPRKHNSGFYGQLAFSRINANRSRWVFGVQGSEKYYQYQDQLTSVYQYLGEAGLYVPLIVNYRRNLLVSLGVGAAAGHEKVGGEIAYKNDVVVVPSDRFICGGFLGVEGEVFLANKVVWFINCKERLTAGSSLETAHLNVGSGFKFMLNN